jgi:hypothetical protein
MKHLLLFFLVLYSFSVCSQTDPYDRNKTENKNTRKGETERPKNQDQNGEVKEKTAPNYQSVGKSDVNNSQQVVSSVSSLVGSLGMISDNYTGDATTLKLQFGLGISQFPLIVNATSYSTTEKIYMLDVPIGMNLGIFKNRGISFNIKPFYTFKLPGIIKGNAGTISEAGVNIVGYFSTQAESQFKLFTHFGYRKVSGSFDSDGSNGDAFSAKLDYSVMKIGGGIMFYQVFDDKELWIKPGFFLEKPSFLSADQSPIKTINLNINIMSEIEIDFSISNNYFIGGQIENTKQFIPKNQTFYNVTLIRNGKIF